MNRRLTLFVPAGARIIFAADIHQLNHFAVAFVSIVIETEALDISVCSTVTGLLQSVHAVALRNRADGVRNVPPIYVRAAQTMGSSGLHTWTFVIVPASLPFIISGMKQGWAFAWRSLMAAEIYVTILTGFGLGQVLHFGRELHDMEAVLGIMIIIVVIGLAADKIFFAPFERMLHRKWGTSRA